MSLAPGIRFGSYEVAAQIGAGGMGEVYRATDLALKRSVAIKVLPDAVAADSERLARFRREREVLAALNHPNIAQIYGVERADGVTALVMELVEGPTLADRIARGPIPVDEALPIAKQIAEALEAAHERSIIHRDLKPANIKVRDDGTVKVLDFGLAKAMDPTSAGQDVSPADIANSPTLTSPAISQAHVILGTAAYMSPEQARGRPVDKRTDIWAFGCVLFEMLTGGRAFAGSDVADTLGAVIHKLPDLSRLPASLPPAVRKLIERCLDKDPRRRLRDIGEARLAVEEPAVLVEPASTSARMPAWRTLALAGVMAVAAGAVTAVVMRPAPTSTEAEPAPQRLALPLAPDESVMLFRGLAISPDERRLAFVSQVGRGTPRLVVRHLDGSRDVVLEDTGSATSPFFSPDNQWVGFIAGGVLKKVPTSGGAPETVTNQARGNGGAAWAPDGWIYLSGRDGILRVPAGGGEAERVTKLQRDRGEIAHVWPTLLPGTDVLLYVAWTGPGWDERQIVARRLTSGRDMVIMRRAATVRYVESGHLVYTREGRMAAVPFDIATLETTGPPVPLLDDVREGLASADYDISPGGTLVYVHQSREAYNRVPVLVERSGAGQPLPGVPPGFYQNPRFSPDGRRALMQRADATIDLWLYDFDRQTFSVLRSNGSNQHPEWSPDAQRVVYRGTRQGSRNLFMRRVDDVASELRLTTDQRVQTPWSWVGNTISFSQDDLDTRGDISLLDAAGAGTVRMVMQTEFDERKARLSPDGTTLAYVSDESGRAQVYARMLDAARREQLSTDGGTDPVWARDGRQVFYRNGRRVMVVDVAEGGRPTSGPRLLFEGDYVITNPAIDFDVSPDGSRFLMIRISQNETPRPQVEVFLNWQQELRRQAPVK